MSLILIATFAGCATAPPPPVLTERIVLLPGANGKVGKVAVSANGAATIVDSAYGQASVDSAGKVAASITDEASVHRDFAAALGALPPRPVSHILYFEVNSDRLTKKSAEDAKSILADIAARPLADIVIIGHTDTMGELAYNDKLSLQRAESLRQQLIKLGGDPKRLSVAGRGEREPLVPTEDETPEPRNRRAELSVR